MKILMLFATTLLLITSCDTKKEGDTNGDGKISSKDMDRDQQIAECKKRASQEIPEGVIPDDQLDPMIDEYCGCAIDKMIERDMTGEEILRAYQDVNKLQEVIGDCINDLQSNIMEAMSDVTVSDELVDEHDGVEKCINAFYASFGEAQTDAIGKDNLDPIVEEYCSCAMDKFVAEGMDMSEMTNMSPDQVNEIAGECLTNFQKGMIELSSAM